MTEARDLPNIRRVFVATLAAFTAIGVLRGTVNLFIDRRSWQEALYVYRVTIGISWFWIPVALAVAALWPWRRLRRRFLAAHAILLTLVIFSEVAWMSLVFHALSRRAGLAPYSVRLIGRFDTNLLMYAAIVGAIWAAESVRRDNVTRLAAAKLDSLLADTRLYVLTLQLHPHFLFNTLNLISQLAYRDVEAARRTLGHLRALLVQSLTHAGSRAVSLREELRFLGAYLEIQQRRFGDRLSVRIDADTEAMAAAVPHLLLQPLVENAIIHGLANRPDRGELRVTARVTRDRLVITIEDDGIGLGSKPVVDRVGLSNTRLRIRQFSNDDCLFDIQPRSDGGTVVTITLPARSAPDPAASDMGADSGLYDAGEEAAATDAPRAASRQSVGVQIVAGWTAIAVLWTELSAAQQLARHTPIEWGQPFAASVVNVSILALLTPLVLWLARRLDVIERASWQRVLVHAGAAATLAVVHMGLLLGILRAFLVYEYEVERANMFGWGIWDIVAYATIVTFGTIATLAARHRQAFVAMAVTRSRIANARLASLRLRLQPAVLLRGLDAIGNAMATDPERTEHAITRMGDLLRGLLARVERDNVSLDAEIAALRAFTDVVDPRVTIDVSSDVSDAIIPAGLITALAAALDELTVVAVRTRGCDLDVTLLARGANVDDAQVVQVRDRLRKRYADAASLSLETSGADVVVMHLRFPLERSTMFEDDEPVIEPQLVPT